MAGSKTAATRRITDDKKERARAEARSARRIYERQKGSDSVVQR